MALSRGLLEACEKDLICETDPVYLITWNPKDRFDTTGDYTQKWMTMILRVLKHFNRCMRYFVVVPEVSDKGRLHAHGFFVLKDKTKWLKSVLPLLKCNGFVKINKMNSFKALHYYKKELDDTASLIPSMEIVLSHLNIRRVLRDIRIKHLSDYDDEKVKKINILDYFDVE